LFKVITGTKRLLLYAVDVNLTHIRVM